MNYIYYALLTVVCWGTYGICMHTGSVNMKDAENGRIMAFLWVGLAYFLTAVVAPLIILKLKGGNIAFWNYPNLRLEMVSYCRHVGGGRGLGRPACLRFRSCRKAYAARLVRTCSYVDYLCRSADG